MSKEGQVEGGPTGKHVGLIPDGHGQQFGYQNGESGAIGLGGQQAGMAGDQAGGAAQQGVQAQGSGAKNNLGAAQSGPGGMMGAASS